MDCGHLPEELQHFAAGRHTFAEFRIFGELSLILCDFCQVDFGSYDPTYFGLPSTSKVGYEHMSLVCDIFPPAHTFDKICPDCKRRLRFLEFVSAARELHRSTVV